MVFCDMPGYKDTCSFHVDISAAVWINDVAKVAKTLRIIVLIHSATLIEDRGEPFRDLMRLLTKLMKGEPERVALSCMFLFTHMSDQFPHERDEAEILKVVYDEITSISRAKHHQKNFLMKILRDFILDHNVRLRVLNPVTTDIKGLISTLQHTVHPLPSKEAQAYLQCSLSREIEMAVDFALDGLKTSIEMALYASSSEKQRNLLELFRLLAAFVDLLKKDKYRKLLDETLKNAAENYKKCLEEVKKVVDGGAKEDRVSVVSKEEVELVVPQLHKLPVLDQILREGGWKEIVHPNSIMDELQLEYHRKCLLIKIDVLGMIRTEVDYSGILQHIQNLASLEMLNNEMGKILTTNRLCFYSSPHSCTRATRAFILMRVFSVA
jgi:hypothetical protein